MKIVMWWGWAFPIFKGRKANNHLNGFLVFWIIMCSLSIIFCKQEWMNTGLVEPINAEDVSRFLFFYTAIWFCACSVITNSPSMFVTNLFCAWSLKYAFKSRPSIIISICFFLWILKYPVANRLSWIIAIFFFTKVLVINSCLF